MASASASSSRYDVEFDDLPDGVEDLAVVHRLLEVVVDAGALQVLGELDIHLERLGCPLLPLENAVASLEPHVREDDPVAQRGPPSGSTQVPRTTASVIRAARTFARTSWTRTMSVPAAMPRVVVASVASRRSPAGRSRTRPRVDLRLVPRRIGRPSRRSVPSSRRSSRLWSGVLPNPKSGIDDQVVPGHSEAGGAVKRALQVRDELRQEGPVARLCAVVHDDDRDAVIGCETGQRVVVADAPDVVDEVRAGGEGCLGDGGLGRVHADRGVGKCLAHGRDDRQDPPPLLLGGDRGVAGPCRLAADVEDVGTLLDHPAGLGDGGSDPGRRCR